MLDHLEESDDEQLDFSDKQGKSLGIPQIPEIMIDNTDRNRTSPFAFTGNRFEFRAIGSEANCASAMIALNAAMAEQLKEFKNDVDSLIDKGEPKIHAILKVIRQYIKDSKPIRFDEMATAKSGKKKPSAADWTARHPVRSSLTIICQNPASRCLNPQVS